jgi:peptidoglycan-associated lipoprotein
MKLLTKIILVTAGLALAACTSPGRFDNGNTVDLNNPGAGDPGAGEFAPDSPSYFNQTIGDRVLFVVDQSTLTDQAQQVLVAQADWLNLNTDYSVLIEGHADEQGTREYNLALGARRASAVQQFLISRGVAPGRLKTVTYGKERPIEICSDETCYSKNRRAVSVLQAGGIS